jgi:hypothetical protein
MRIGVIAAVVIVIGIVLYAGYTTINESDAPPPATKTGTETATKTDTETATKTGTETATKTGTETATKTGTETATKTGTETATKTGTETAAAAEPASATPTIAEIDDDNPPGTLPPAPEAATKSFVDPLTVKALTDKYTATELSLPASVGRKLGAAPPESLYALLDLKKSGASHDQLIAFVRTKLTGDIRVKLWTSIWLEAQNDSIRTANSAPAPTKGTK